MELACSRWKIVRPVDWSESGLRWVAAPSGRNCDLDCRVGIGSKPFRSAHPAQPACRCSATGRAGGRNFQDRNSRSSATSSSTFRFADWALPVETVASRRTKQVMRRKVCCDITTLIPLESFSSSSCSSSTHREYDSAHEPRKSLSPRRRPYTSFTSPTAPPLRPWPCSRPQLP